jgi:heptaprenylglyceryl phosphate synthase
MTVKKAVFNAIMNATDGDYIIRAQLLAAMQPNGW